VGRAEAFPAVAEAILTWRLQRGVGMRIREAPSRVHDNARFSARFLGVPVECVVLESWDEPARAGFTYRTLPGHVLEGEETFAVEVTDGRTVVTISETSRPASAITRIPGARLAQNAINRRYLRVIERVARKA
jgi:uncharacterized protein (UPF0548 family)